MGHPAMAGKPKLRRILMQDGTLIPALPVPSPVRLREQSNHPLITRLSTPLAPAGPSVHACLYALTQPHNDTHLARAGRRPGESHGGRSDARTRPRQGRGESPGEGKTGIIEEQGEGAVACWHAGSRLDG